MVILSKVNYRFKVVPIQIPENLKNNPEIYMEAQKTLNSKSYLEQKQNAGGIIRVPDFRQKQDWHKNRHIGQ
jgi:hypothetical protein